MGRYVLGFDEIRQAQVAVVGGKGSHLGQLSQIEGVRVPAGFCVTAEAFQRMLAEVPSIDDRLERLSHLGLDDGEAIHALSAEIRRTLEGAAIPGDLAAAITRRLSRFGEQAAWAVRSSAPAEDRPTASFAGQHDTFLNVVGPAAVFGHLSRCWASLFSERAVAYRVRKGIDHRRVSMAVVVQQMVAPQAAGILFTAHPVTGNRRVSSVEAGFGLGEALVSGLVDADVYEVRDGDLVSKTVGMKRVAIQASSGGGTMEDAIEPERAAQPALTDMQVVRLVQIGREIETHFGRPQDIEWCLADDEFHIVQSRPITTLFPIPEAGDQENRVYVSVGHGQMMTDAMKPLGLSVWQLTTPRPMYVAGGRLFVDVTPELASPTRRQGFLEVMGRGDPLIGDALQTILQRDDFIPSPPDRNSDQAPAGDAPAPIATDPAVVTELIGQTQGSIAALKRDIRTKSGSALLEFILEDIGELRRILFDPRSHQVIMAGMEATWWLNERLLTWLGEKNAADTLTRSVPHNVTSEMGLALLDVADVIRPHAEVISFLQHVEDDSFLDELPNLAGGGDARDAIRAWLDEFGMRCVGEIDITRPRWSEHPSALLPILLGHIENSGPGAGARRFEQGRRVARKKEQDVLKRLRALPDGERKAEEAKSMIERVRMFIGYREYPKYGMVSRYFVYKRALLEEAERLTQAGVLLEKEDIFWFTVQELREVVRTRRLDRHVIDGRKDEFRLFEGLTPPRVLTSEGEAIAGAYRRDDVPADALAGLPVSAGTAEGRARVISDMSDADLVPGDILVAPYTDPSWTPLFVTIEGLVTEVGGLMTHGAVIAREYGLPAVVGVEHATHLIRDGQRIRVHGTDGYVEILP